MALINCSECGGQVSDKALACPSCGNPIVSAIKGKLCIYGYTSFFLINPNFAVYKNGVYIGTISKEGYMEVEIEQDCFITFQGFSTSNEYQAKKDKVEKIQLHIERLTGRLKISSKDIKT